MRYLLLLLALLGSVPGLAQSLAAPDSAVVALPAAEAGAATPPAAPDTAAALHRYFAQRRRRGGQVLAVGAGIVAVSYTAAAIANKGGSLSTFSSGVLGVVVGVPVLVSGIALAASHSRNREEEVLQDWRQHRLARRWVRRALVPRYTQAL